MAWNMDHGWRWIRVFPLSKHLPVAQTPDADGDQTGAIEMAQPRLAQGEALVTRVVEDDQEGTE